VGAGIGKLLARDGFLETVTSLYLLPKSLTYFVSLGLPWAELLIGCLLIAGLFCRLIVASAISLILLFIGANIYSLLLWGTWGEAGCGCFGDIIRLGHLQALLLNGAMIVMAFVVLSGLCHPKNRGVD